MGSAAHTLAVRLSWPQCKPGLGRVLPCMRARCTRLLADLNGCTIPTTSAGGGPAATGTTPESSHKQACMDAATQASLYCCMHSRASKQRTSCAEPATRVSSARSPADRMKLPARIFLACSLAFCSPLCPQAPLCEVRTPTLIVKQQSEQTSPVRNTPRSHVEHPHSLDTCGIVA